jgi:hypothetical protein
MKAEHVTICIIPQTWHSFLNSHSSLSIISSHPTAEVAVAVNLPLSIL